LKLIPLRDRHHSARSATSMKRPRRDRSRPTKPQRYPCFLVSSRRRSKSAIYRSASPSLRNKSSLLEKRRTYGAFPVTVLSLAAGEP
jgi:hypothetical protein